MKRVIASLSAIALASAPALAAEPAAYDLWQSAETGKAAIAIAAVGEKAPFAAATGESKAALDILPSDEASLVIAALRAKTAAKIEIAETAIGDDEAAGGEDHADHASHADHKAQMTKAEGGEAQARKIILVKETVAAEKDKAEQKEVRRIIKVKSDGDMSDAEIAALVQKAKAELENGENAKIEVETEKLAGDDADAAMIASAQSGKVLVIEDEIDGAPTRLVSVSGADADAARAFIDGAEGLDDQEKSKMKADLGL
jgi:hypothetical protein